MPCWTSEGASAMGGHNNPQHNFAVYTPMIIEFGTVMELDLFYTTVTKRRLEFGVML